MRVARWGLAALLIVAATASVWLAGAEFLTLYRLADPNLKLGVLTAIGSGIAFMWTTLHQSRRERQARLFESKREAYDKFFEFFFGIFDAQRAGKPLSDAKLVQMFSEFTRNVMTWGSAAAINAVNEYQRASTDVPPGDLKALFRNTETLLRALRSDLGHGDSALEPFALTKLILKAEEHHKLD